MRLCVSLGFLFFLPIPSFALAADYDPLSPAPDPAVCSLEYVLPGDVSPVDDGQAADGNFVQFAWRTFLALSAPAPGGQISVDGDNAPQWSQWSSTTDLLNARTPGPWGTRHYPPICRLVPGHENYRVLQQVSKVDDSFLEANDLGLSADPLLDANGNFLRFEIMLSPAVYNQAVDEELYDRKRLNGRLKNVNLICGELSYTGGNPEDPRMGAMVLKAAWMQAAGFSETQKSRFHMQSALVFTPAYRNATGRPTCEIEEMALVGLHVARKTESQQAWTWATWEHLDNAPDCTAQMPNGKGGPVNHTCPAVPSEDYNFFSSSCQDELSEGPCQVCNVAPEKNSTPETACTNPFDRGTCSGDPGISCVTRSDCRSQNAGECMNKGWCLDRPPANVAGTSRLCRQVPTDRGVCSLDPSILCAEDVDCASESAGFCNANYPKADQWNVACQAAIDATGDGNSVWRNYGLVGIQWLASDFSGCENVQGVVFPEGGPVNYSVITPEVQVVGDGTKGNAQRPILGNTSMESYERSNCTGCHSKTGLQGICSNDFNQTCTVDFECPEGGVCDQVTTDFMYWLKLEVGDPPAILSEGRRFRFKTQNQHTGAVNRVRMRFNDKVAFVPERLGSQDPRCHADPGGTVKATLRFFNNEHEVDSLAIDLPCENWKQAGKGGYRYRSNEGRCRRVHLVKGKRIFASCRDVKLLDRFVPAGASLSSVLDLNGVRYCATFEDFVEKEHRRADRFVSRVGSIGAQCPVPLRLLGVAAPGP